MSKSKFYKWTVEIEIADTWVADGVDLTSERMHDLICHAFPYAYGHELKAKTIKAPSDESIAKEQGYASVEAFRASRKKG